MPYQLRQLFPTILVYSQIAEVRTLWDGFYADMAKDFDFKYRLLEGQAKENMVQFHTLKRFHDLLQASGPGLDRFDLPQLNQFSDLMLLALVENNLIRREMKLRS